MESVWLLFVFSDIQKDFWSSLCHKFLDELEDNGISRLHCFMLQGTTSREKSLQSS